MSREKPFFLKQKYVTEKFLTTMRTSSSAKLGGDFRETGVNRDGRSEALCCPHSDVLPHW